MEITKAGSPIGANLGKISSNQDVNKITPTVIGTQGNTSITPYNSIDLINLKNQLRTSFNQFIGHPESKPLLPETLSDLQSKFWPSENSDKAKFSNMIWEACRDVAFEFNKTIHPRQQSLISNPITSSKPTVFSTREGLDIVLELNHNGNDLDITSISFNAGGSSVNVARALNNFETPANLLGIVGSGQKGNIFLDLLQKEGINTSSFLKVVEDSRFHFCKLYDGKEHWIVSLSPELNKEELNKFTDLLMKTCTENKGEALALANNPPAGANNDYTTNIIREATNRFGMFVIYDTKLHAVGKDLLEAVLKSGPSMIKPNISEYAEIVGRDENKLRNNKDQIIHLAKELIEKYGINKILISLDKDGAILVDRKRAAHAIPPKVKVVSTVGAGDTGIASIIDRGKKRNYSLHEPTDEGFMSLLSAFVAGGCATVMKPGTELASLEERDKIETGVMVKLI